MGAHTTRMSVMAISLHSSRNVLTKGPPYTVPELRIYRVWKKAVGPHPLPMFEVNVFSPAEFGAFVAWLVVHRGPLSALVHPNTGDDIRDHTINATWMGTPLELDIEVLRKFEEAKTV